MFNIFFKIKWFSTIEVCEIFQKAGNCPLNKKLFISDMN